MLEEIAQPESEMATRSDAWTDTFIASYKKCGIVTVAAEAAGISRQTADAHRRKDREFREAWDSAHQDAIDVLRRRAVDLTDPSNPDYNARVASGMLQYLLKSDWTKGVREVSATVTVTFNGVPRTIQSLDELTNDELRMMNTGELTSDGDLTVLFDQIDEDMSNESEDFP